MSIIVHGAGNRVYGRPVRKPRTKKAILAYLTEHYRYDGRYARCVKFNRLNMSDAALQTASDAWMLEWSELYNIVVHDILKAFRLRHKDTAHEIEFAGRSGDYLTLYATRDDPDELMTWALADLRDRLAVVWDFDETVEQAIDAFIDWCERHEYVEKTLMVSRTVKVAQERHAQA